MIANSTGQSQWLIVLLITLTIVIVEVAVSFSSALLPHLKADLSVSDQLVQWTIGTIVLAIALSGLFYGSFSDRFGRRPILIVGLTFFTLGAIGSAFSFNITLLLISRFVQGLGAGVAWTVGNACLKDIFDEKGYAKVMNQVHAVAGIVPAMAPFIGSYLGSLIGWRACFGLVFMVSSFLLIVKFFHLPETNTKKVNLTGKAMLLSYAVLFKNTKYLTYLTIKVLAVMLLLVEVANIPLIFVEYKGVPSAYYGLYALPAFSAYAFATYISSKVVYKYSVNSVLLLGLALILISNGLLVGLESFYSLSAIQIQGVKLLTYAGWGFIFGNATAALISAASQNAGAASALMIVFEMLFSALGIYVLGIFFTGSIIPLSIFMALISLFCAAELGLTKIKRVRTR